MNLARNQMPFAFRIQTTCISLSTVFFSVVSGWDIRRKKTFAQIYSFHFVIAFNPFGNPIINYSNTKYYQLSTYSVFDQSMRTLVTLLISYYSDISWLLKGLYTIILGKIFALNIAFALNLKIWYHIYLIFRFIYIYLYHEM